MNKIQYVVIAIILGLTFQSCDKEVIKIDAEISNCEYDQVEVKVIPMSGEKKAINLGKCDVDGGFDLKIKKVKPPVKLTFQFKDTVCSTWIGQYGKNKLAGDFKKEIKLSVTNVYFNGELKRFIKANDDAYLSKIRKAEKELENLHDLEDAGSLSIDMKEKMYAMENQVKKAYKLRKKAILSAVRTNPSNNIAMVVMFDMYNSLTSWQKKECKKNAKKYFDDSGLNWQLKN